MRALQHQWAIVLAGGEGKRLASFGMGASGCSIPKQYRTLAGDKSMLQWTVERARALVPVDRIVCIVAPEHRRWWQSELACLPANNVVIQPENKGTAAGVLLPLLSILERDPEAGILVLPSDHHVEDEGLMLEVLHQACRLAQTHAQRVILIGMEATPDAADYGWIVPGVPIADPTLRRVITFCEKPDPSTSRRLRYLGALVNSLIVAASGRALLALLAEAIPEIVERFAIHSCEKASVLRETQTLYDGMASSDFSREVLERRPEQLLVYPAPSACGWSDLGTPARMGRFLELHQASAA
jgi:mannose-1-phosphate guanylyltransferase